jgi:hypothetical protein
MKLFLPLFIGILFCISCNKKYIPDDPGKNNEFHALLVFSADSSQRFDVIGTKAGMGCSWGTTYVEGLREDDAYINLQLYFDEMRCLSSPGTLTTELRCQYRPNLYEGNIYGNNSANPGIVTFTTVTTDYMEGHFETVCNISATDSVIITGTFKGVKS